VGDGDPSELRGCRALGHDLAHHAGERGRNDGVLGKGEHTVRPDVCLVPEARGVHVVCVGAAVACELPVPEVGAPGGLSAAPVAPNLTECNAKGPDVGSRCRGASVLDLRGVVEGGAAARHGLLDRGLGH
jgi:transcriptional regulator GlxA family with amidase domain